MLIPLLVVAGMFVTLLLLAQWGARAEERRQEAHARSEQMHLSRGRRRRDERAWRDWQQLEAIRAEPLEHGQMVGRVYQVYQQARDGTKAFVDFDPPIGRQDTWWPWRRLGRGEWVLVRAHLGWGPHHEREVWYIDAVDKVWPADLATRAERFANEVDTARHRAGAQ